MLNLNFIPFPQIATERLFLRQLSINDEQEIFLLRSDEQVNKYLERQKATSLKDAQDFINKINTAISNNETLYWGITLSGSNKLVGTITLWNIDKENDKAEIGYELVTKYQGKGLMQEALSAVINYGFVAMKLESIAAYTHAENLQSAKLLEKNNFKKQVEQQSGEEVIYYLAKENWLTTKLRTQ